MSRRLRSGAPRLLDRHDGASGRRYDAHYRGLAARLGPFREPFLRDQAGAVAVLWVEFWESGRTLSAARRNRQRGRGRRPSEQAVARLQKRHGLAWESYSQALRRLEELASQNGHGRDLARAIAEAQAARGKV